MILSYGSKGDAVGLLQEQLNQFTTRLERLNVNEKYDTLTMARAMEFQFDEKLQPDGVCGQMTLVKINKKQPDFLQPRGMAIVADLINDHLWAYENGREVLDTRRIEGGTIIHPTKRGAFPVHKALRYHTSTSYPIPLGNMDCALYFDGPCALHKGSPREPSHGCIHVAPRKALKLFDWATFPPQKAEVADTPRQHRNVLVLVLKKTR